MDRSPSDTAILLRDVHFSYGDTEVLDGVDLEVAAGGFSALIGPNGSGKSTCLRLILGLLTPDSGEVRVFGQPAGRHDDPLGYVPQRVDIPPGFPLSAEEVVIMGRYGHLGLFTRPRREDRRRAAEALDQVGLADLRRRLFSELSGGQQQRVLIARALAGEPQLLLLDEPTAGLDPAAQARFYALVCDLQRARGLSLLCASHDVELVAEHADTLILLDRTVRAAGPPSEVLASDALERSYHFPARHVHDDG